MFSGWRDSAVRLCLYETAVDVIYWRALPLLYVYITNYSTWFSPCPTKYNKTLTVFKDVLCAAQHATTVHVHSTAVLVASICNASFG